MIDSKKVYFESAHSLLKPSVEVLGSVFNLGSKSLLYRSCITWFGESCLIDTKFNFSDDTWNIY